MRDPVVFLPGLMCDLRVYGPQLIDLGRELSVAVAPVSDGERIEQIASNILNHLPAKFALVGLSLGGVVAMEILRRAPNRVTRIALMSTNSLAETPQSAADYEPSIIKLRSGQMNEAVQALIPSEHLAPGVERATIVGQLGEMAANVGADAIIRQIRALQRRSDYQPVLRRCKVPALVLCGEHDGLTPVKRHSFMAELIPDAELKVIEGAGHLPTIEQPEATTQALRAWLNLPYLLQ